jgi:hypothetical protein
MQIGLSPDTQKLLQMQALQPGAPDSPRTTANMGYGVATPDNGPAL